MTAIWGQIAAFFADVPDVPDDTLVFELFNEPYYMNSTRLNEMNAALVPAIRKNSPTRQLHLGGLAHMKSSWLMSASQRTPLDLPEPSPTAYRNRPLQAANPDVIIFPPARPAHVLAASISATVGSGRRRFLCFSAFFGLFRHGQSRTAQAV